MDGRFRFLSPRGEMGIEASPLFELDLKMFRPLLRSRRSDPESDLGRPRAGGV